MSLSARVRARWLRRRLEKRLNPSVKWDIRMLRLAREVSTWSKDPSTQVGAVLADRNYRIISMGFNGFPRDVEDKPEWLADRDVKYPLIIHAEKNAIAFARGELKDATMFTYPMPPCVPCTSYLLQNGISRIVSTALEDEGHVERWGKSTQFARDLFLDANKLYRLYPPDSLDTGTTHKPNWIGPHSACDGTCSTGVAKQ